ncbi:MAG: potassium transporter TrkH [Alphaproteobacteria bacterium]|nr:MAG: potassium transporter TrkH [Alphaproteobacteria bacterium]
MINRNIIASVIGNILFFVCFLELIPALVDYIAGSLEYRVFLSSAFLTGTLGGLLYFSFRGYENHLPSRKMIYLITTVAWVAMPLAASLPIYMAIPEASFADAVFEAVSGLTTTGSTVFTGLDQMPMGILLWRAILQWIGGVGIIVLGIWILPVLQVGGMALFQTESSDQSEKIYPRTIELVRSILVIYSFITVACILVYFTMGMGMFDAISHALTTVSTGGFSTHDQSIKYFNSPGIEWAVILFMFAGAVPFVAYMRCLKGSLKPLVTDAQIRALVLFLLITSVIIIFPLWQHPDLDFLTSFRGSVFSVMSIVTTTGFITIDYTNFGAEAGTIFLILTVVGGCTGSTAGGIKVFRFAVLWQALQSVFHKMVYPHSVYTSRYNGRILSNDIVVSVLIFFCVFIFFMTFLAIALGFAGLYPLEALSAAATAIANVGPGMGEAIGPSGNFATIPTSAKWLMSFGMIVGRLEFLTVLVLFIPRYWYDL